MTRARRIAGLKRRCGSGNRNPKDSVAAYTSFRVRDFHKRRRPTGAPNPSAGALFERPAGGRVCPVPAIRGEPHAQGANGVWNGGRGGRSFGEAERWVVVTAKLPVAHFAFAESPILAGFKARGVNPPHRAIRKVLDRAINARALRQAFGKYPRPLSDEPVTEPNEARPPDCLEAEQIRRS